MSFNTYTQLLYPIELLKYTFVVVGTSLIKSTVPSEFIVKILQFKLVSWDILWALLYPETAVDRE